MFTTQSSDPKVTIHFLYIFLSKALDIHIFVCIYYPDQVIAFLAPSEVIVGRFRSKAC